MCFISVAYFGTYTLEAFFRGGKEKESSITGPQGKQVYELLPTSC